jgi:hypothetical protein
MTSCPKPENIIVPAITEFLIIDLFEPVLFVRSLLKIDIKKFDLSKMIIIFIFADNRRYQML